MIHVRAAGPIDAAPMAELLNEVIAEGGTTAMTKPVYKDDLVQWIRHYSGRNAWFLAEDDDGVLLGFQWIEPHDDLPVEACAIATFSRVGRTRLGSGSALFNHTKAAARLLGYRWINATIQADNDGGLAYYQSRGFESYGDIERAILNDGTPVIKIRKRFDLR